MTIRDLKLPALLNVWRSPANVPTLKTEGLEPVLEAHRRNIRRVHNLTWFPIELITGLVIVTRTTRAVLEEWEAALEAGKITEKQIKEKASAALLRAFNDREVIVSANDEAGKKLIEQEETYACTMINTFLAKDLKDGADAWFSAQVTGIWTSFEALAEELWEAALNIHPRGLAELKGRKKSGDQDKTIELSFLQRHGYNVSGAMGTILKTKYSFDRLDGICAAYGDAFRTEKFTCIVGDTSLIALSAVRNLIVHSGGIVDVDYLKRRLHLPKEAHGELGKPIVLDGQITAALIARPMQLGLELIAAVDDWISEEKS